MKASIWIGVPGTCYSQIMPKCSRVSCRFSHRMVDWKGVPPRKKKTQIIPFQPEHHRDLIPPVSPFLFVSFHFFPQISWHLQKNLGVFNTPPFQHGFSISIVAKNDRYATSSIYIMYLQCKIPIVVLQIPSLDQPCVLASARLAMWLPLKPPFEATCRTKQPNKWCLAVQCTTGWCHGNNPGFFGAWFQFHSGDVISLQRTTVDPTLDRNLW